MTKKSKEKTETKPEVKEEKVTLEQELEPVSEPPRELTPIEKAKIVSAMAAAATNPDLLTTMESLDHGSEIKQLFEDAINNKIQEIMSGTSVQDTAQAQSLSAATHRAHLMMEEMRRFMLNVMNTPLVEVLNIMNRNLGGQQHQFSQETLEQNQQPERNYVYSTQVNQPTQPIGNVTAARSGSTGRGEGGFGTGF